MAKVIDIRPSSNEMRIHFELQSTRTNEYWTHYAKKIVNNDTEMWDIFEDPDINIGFILCEFSYIELNIVFNAYTYKAEFLGSSKTFKKALKKVVTQ